ncbi:hypothetical protein T265_08432 [Opisthorchis viverrini]|uniref:Uncharacterized protein n=1 Tax=Opisthorchis viverrini TaxID=6198 RepID=A0A074Z954_OPIVI|nr:hypothetical protein T265_08432 [Opisthorchis viverrini]KER23741.1 hypothetical protein T265_08432 [Opisthorchis viverrini]
MKEITKRLGAVGATRLSGWGARDPHCAWLETLQEMAANRCQWRPCYCLRECLEGLSNKSWLYGSEASVLNTDVMLSMMVMMIPDKRACRNKNRDTFIHHLSWAYWFAVKEYWANVIEDLLTGGSVIRTQSLHFGFSLGLSNWAVSQYSYFLRVAWQLGTERVLQSKDFFKGGLVTCPHRHPEEA